MKNFYIGLWKNYEKKRLHSPDFFWNTYRRFLLGFDEEFEFFGGDELEIVHLLTKLSFDFDFSSIQIATCKWENDQIFIRKNVYGLKIMFKSGTILFSTDNYNFSYLNARSFDPKGTYLHV